MEIGVAAAKSAASTEISAEAVWFDETLTLNVKASDPVDRMRAQIQGMQGIPMKQRSLIFQDEVLEDTEPMNSYDIGHESTLFSADEPRYWRKPGTPELYELMRPEQKVGNIGCRLCWCWMGPDSEYSHWNSQKKHGRKLQHYTGPPCANNFKEVHTSAGDHDSAA